MTPERWKQVREVPGDALELKPEDRPAFIDRACASIQGCAAKWNLCLPVNELFSLVHLDF
jgi:hypothetical protein